MQHIFIRLSKKSATKHAFQTVYMYATMNGTNTWEAHVRHEQIVCSLVTWFTTLEDKSPGPPPLLLHASGGLDPLKNA